MRKTLHDFVIEHLKDLDSTAISDVLSYAKLTNRKPKLGDFVPCDLGGNVLEEPKGYEYFVHSKTKDSIVWGKCKQYQQALSRCIFKGDWEMIDWELYTRVECNKTGIWIEKGKISQDWYCKKGIINRIEDLPLEIEFKEGVI